MAFAGVVRFLGSVRQINAAVAGTAGTVLSRHYRFERAFRIASHVFLVAMFAVIAWVAMILLGFAHEPQVGRWEALAALVAVLMGLNVWLMRLIVYLQAMEPVSEALLEDYERLMAPSGLSVKIKALKLKADVAMAIAAARKNNAQSN